MMRNAYFGTNALFLLGLHILMFSMDLIFQLPYVRTLFFPMFNIIILMLAVLGTFQKDRLKLPAIIALVISAGTLIFWIVLLVMRVKT